MNYQGRIIYDTNFCIINNFIWGFMWGDFSGNFYSSLLRK
jgi:hypothetical protein